MGAARPADRPAGPGEDRLFVTTDAAFRLGASKDWLYRNSSRLPFTVRLSERALRYSAKGIDRWIVGCQPLLDHVHGPA